MATCRFPDEEHPFFTRHAWLGWLLILLALALFAVTSYSLLTRTLLFPFDQVLMNRLKPIDASMPGWLASALTFLANAASLGPNLVLAFLSCRWLRRKCDDRFTLLLMRYEVGLLLFWLISLLFNRERPALPGLLAQFPFPSYPSGHLIQTITLLAPLLYLSMPRIRSSGTRALVIVLALAYTLLIAFNRVILNAHYLTDVLAGAAVGLFWAVVVLKGFEWHHMRIGTNRSRQV